MDYKIVEGLNIRDLTRKVKLAIEDGWKPTGGIAITKETIQQSPNNHVFQAMIKE